MEGAMSRNTDILAALARLRRKVRNIFEGVFPALKRRAIGVHPYGISKWPAASRDLFCVAVTVCSAKAGSDR
jgi:hypothetical protein